MHVPRICYLLSSIASLWFLTIRQYHQILCRDGHKKETEFDLVGVWVSFERDCRSLLVSQGWIALLRYYLQVTELILCNLQKDKEIWDNAHTLLNTAFTFVQLREYYESRHRSDEGALAADIRKFCRNNLNNLVPNIRRLSQSFPSAQDSTEVRRLSQRVEWTDLLHKLPESINSVYFEAEVREAK